MLDYTFWPLSVGFGKSNVRKVWWTFLVCLLICRQGALLQLGKVGRPTAGQDPSPITCRDPDNFRTCHQRCGGHSLLLSTSFARAFTTQWLLVSIRVPWRLREKKEGNKTSRLTTRRQFAIPVPSSSRARPASARGPSTSSSSKYALCHPSTRPYASAIPDTRARDTLTPSRSPSPTRPVARGPASSMASTTTS